MESNASSKTKIQLGIFLKVLTNQLDRTILYKQRRWMFFYGLLILFFLRMVIVQGYYAIAYLLGFTILQNLILYLTPQEIPTIDEEGEEEVFDIPNSVNFTQSSDNSKPIIRKLSEFNLWKKLTLYCFLAFVSTFIGALDLPVFWPLLLIYFLFASLNVGLRQYRHMQRYGYTLKDFFKKPESKLVRND